VKMRDPDYNLQTNLPNYFSNDVGHHELRADPDAMRDKWEERLKNAQSETERASIRSVLRKLPKRIASIAKGED
jgi:uncharacterized protein YeeX (DUF496 family)